MDRLSPDRISSKLLALMPNDREHKLITIASFADNIQAAFMREQLEANGIAAFIPDEHAAQMTGIPNVFVSPRRRPPFGCRSY